MSAEASVKQPYYSNTLQVHVYVQCFLLICGIGLNMDMLQAVCHTILVFIYLKQICGSHIGLDLGFRNSISYFKNTFPQRVFFKRNEFC